MILESQYHVLVQLLPHVLPQSDNLRKRPHSRQIPNRCSYLTDCKILTRMLFADSYWWCFTLVLCLYYVCITLTVSISVFKSRVRQFSINEYYYYYYYAKFLTTTLERTYLADRIIIETAILPLCWKHNKHSRTRWLRTAQLKFKIAFVCTSMVWYFI